MVDVTDYSISFFDGVIMDKKFFNGRRRNGFTFLMDEWNFNGQRNFVWTESVLDWENF